MDRMSKREFIREFIYLEKDYEEEILITKTEIDPKNIGRINQYFKDKGYDYQTFHCGHEHDCCGCLCVTGIKAIEIDGSTYFKIRKGYNY